jgi:hypothetical protein
VAAKVGRNLINRVARRTTLEFGRMTPSVRVRQWEEARRRKPWTKKKRFGALYILLLAAQPDLIALRWQHVPARFVSRAR